MQERDPLLLGHLVPPSPPMALATVRRRVEHGHQLRRRGLVLAGHQHRHRVRAPASSSGAPPTRARVEGAQLAALQQARELGAAPVGLLEHNAALAAKACWYHASAGRRPRACRRRVDARGRRRVGPRACGASDDGRFARAALDGRGGHLRREDCRVAHLGDTAALATNECDAAAAALRASMSISGSSTGCTAAERHGWRLRHPRPRRRWDCRRLAPVALVDGRLLDVAAVAGRGGRGEVAAAPPAPGPSAPRCGAERGRFPTGWAAAELGRARPHRGGDVEPARAARSRCRRPSGARAPGAAATARPRSPNRSCGGFFRPLAACARRRKLALVARRAPARRGRRRCWPVSARARRRARARAQRRRAACRWSSIRSCPTSSRCCASRRRPTRRMLTGGALFSCTYGLSMACKEGHRIAAQHRPLLLWMWTYETHVKPPVRHEPPSAFGGQLSNRRFCDGLPPCFNPADEHSRSWDGRALRPTRCSTTASPRPDATSTTQSWCGPRERHGGAHRRARGRARPRVRRRAAEHPRPVRWLSRGLQRHGRRAAERPARGPSGASWAFCATGATCCTRRSTSRPRCASATTSTACARARPSRRRAPTSRRALPATTGRLPLRGSKTNPRSWPTGRRTCATAPRRASMPRAPSSCRKRALHRARARRRRRRRRAARARRAGDGGWCEDEAVPARLYRAALERARSSAGACASRAPAARRRAVCQWRRALPQALSVCAPTHRLAQPRRRAARLPRVVCGRAQHRHRAAVCRQHRQRAARCASAEQAAAAEDPVARMPRSAPRRAVPRAPSLRRVPPREADAPVHLRGPRDLNLGDAPDVAGGGQDARANHF